MKFHLQISGYSIRQIADLIQRPASTVKGYLDGVTSPDPINLSNLAKALGVTEAELVLPRPTEPDDGFLE